MSNSFNRLDVRSVNVSCLDGRRGFSQIVSTSVWHSLHLQYVVHTARPWHLVDIAAITLTISGVNAHPVSGFPFPDHNTQSVYCVIATVVTLIWVVWRNVKSNVFLCLPYGCVCVHMCVCVMMHVSCVILRSTQKPMRWFTTHCYTNTVYYLISFY